MSTATGLVTPSPEATAAADDARRKVADATRELRAAEESHRTEVQRLEQTHTRLANANRDRRELRSRRLDGDDVRDELQQLNIICDEAQEDIETLESRVRDLAAQVAERRTSAQEANRELQHLEMIAQFERIEAQTHGAFDKFKSAFVAAQLALGEYSVGLDEAHTLSKELGRPFVDRSQDLLKLLDYPSGRIQLELSQRGWIRKAIGWGSGFVLTLFPLIRGKETSD